MTLRDLVRKSVEGLRKEFLSENDRNRLVEYILNNSNLIVLKNRVELKSHSLFGVGENNKERELPYELDYVLFTWGKADEDENATFFKKSWYLESFQTFEELEDRLVNVYEGVEIEHVVLINNNIQRYKIDNYSVFSKSEIVWEDIKPYRLICNSNIEHFSSKIDVENKILDMYNSGEIDLEDDDWIIRIENIFDKEQYGFMLSAKTFEVDFNGNKKVQESRFIFINNEDFPF